MNKYFILIVLNAPLAAYGLFNVLLSYKLKKIRPLQTIIRVLFWGAILIGICLVKPITNFLYQNELTDSPPLSIFDVFLATGIMVSLLMVARTYGRIAELETRFTQLHEKLSILLSDSNSK